MFSSGTSHETPYTNSCFFTGWGICYSHEIPEYSLVMNTIYHEYRYDRLSKIPSEIRLLSYSQAPNQRPNFCSFSMGCDAWYIDVIPMVFVARTKVIKAMKIASMPTSHRKLKKEDVAGPG